MKKATKVFIGSIAILLFTVSSLSAQEKEEHAMVYYGGYPKPVIAVSINGKSFEERFVDKDELQTKTWYYDLSPAFKKINELQQQGWELEDYNGMPTISGGGGYTFLLKKKQ